MTFADLTSLTHACLHRLERAINVARRAVNRSVSTAQVSMNA